MDNSGVKYIDTSKPSINNSSTQGHNVSYIDPVTGAQTYSEGVVNPDLPRVEQIDPAIMDAYNKMGITPTPEIANTRGEQDEAVYQSTWDNIAPIFKGAFYSTLSGFSKYLSGYDVGDALDLVNGESKDYGNFLYEFSNKMAQKAEDEQQNIHTLNTNPSSLSNPNWWFDKVNTGAQVLSYGLPMLGESIALAAATSEGGGVAGIADAIKGIGNIGKILEGMKSAKFFAQSALEGLRQGLVMNMGDAYDTYNQTHKSFMDRGYSSNDARKYASIAASSTYVNELLPLTVLHAAELGTLTYNPVTRSTMTFFDKMIGNKYLRNAANLASESVMGGAEMAIRDNVQSLSRKNADYAAGLASNPYSSWNNNNDYSNFWSDLINGAVTGALVHYPMRIIRNSVVKLMNPNAGANENAINTEYNDYQKNSVTQRLDLLGQIKQADANKDFVQSDVLRQKMNNDSVINALHLDSLKGGTQNYDNHINFLQGILNDIDSNNTEELDKFKISPDDYDYIKNSFNKYLIDAKDTKRIYDDAIKNNRPIAAVPITQATIASKILAERRNSILSDLSNNISQDKSLSDEGKSYVNDLVKKAQIEINSASRDNTESENTSLKDIADRLKNYNVSTSDKSLIDTIYNSKIEDTKKIVLDIDKAISDYSDIIKGWSDPDYQKEQEDKANMNIVDRVSNDSSLSSDNIQSIIDDLDTRRVLTKKQKSKLEGIRDIRRAQESTVNSPRTSNPIKDDNENKVNISKKDIRKEAASSPSGNKSKDSFDRFDVQLQHDLSNKAVNIDELNRQKKAAKTMSSITGEDISAEDLKKIEKGYSTGEEDINALEKDFTPEELKELHRISSSKEDYNTKVQTIANFRKKLAQRQAEESGKPIPTKEPQVVNSKEETVKEPAIPSPGNDSLFGDEPLFSASFSNLSDAQKEKAKFSVEDIYNNLKDDLGKEPSFREFMAAAIKHLGESKAKSYYDIFKTGWELNNYGVADSYDDIFNTTASSFRKFDDIFSNEPTQDEVNIHTDNIKKEINLENNPVISIDTNGDPIKADDSNRLSHVANTFAFLSMENEKKTVKNANGTYSTVFSDTGNLNRTTDINHLKLLDPHNVKEGDVFTVGIPNDVGDIVISLYDENGHTVKSGSFRSFDFPEDSQMYKENVPMVIYDKDGDAVAFVHNNSWYNSANMGLKDNYNDQLNLIRDSKNKNLDLRSNVIKGSKNKDYTRTTIKITSKTPGTFYQFDKPRSLHEANPDSDLAVNINSDIVIKGKGGNLESFQNKNRVIDNINDILPNAGTTYDLRLKSVDKNGVEHYQAFDVIREKLTDSQISSVAKIVEAHMAVSGNSIDSQLLEDIKNISGENAKSPQGFEKLFSRFVKKMPVDFSPNTSDNNKKSILVQRVMRNSYMKEGQPFYAIEKGVLYFGRKRNGMSISDISMLKSFKSDDISKDMESIKKLENKDPNTLSDSDKGLLQQLKSNVDSYNRNVSSSIDKLKELLKDTNLNISKEAVSTDGRAFEINDNNEVTPKGSYSEYTKNSIKSNVRSYNIGSENNPNNVTFVQPNIEFELDGSEDKPIKNIINYDKVVDIYKPTDDELRDMILNKQLTTVGKDC